MTQQRPNPKPIRTTLTTWLIRLIVTAVIGIICHYVVKRIDTSDASKMPTASIVVNASPQNNINIDNKPTNSNSISSTGIKKDHGKQQLLPINERPIKFGPQKGPSKDSIPSLIDGVDSARIPKLNIDYFNVKIVFTWHELQQRIRVFTLLKNHDYFIEIEGEGFYDVPYDTTDTRGVIPKMFKTKTYNVTVIDRKFKKRSITQTVEILPFKDTQIEVY